MSTIAAAQNTTATLQAWNACAPPSDHFCIDAMVSVNADRYRIYQALTVPEYIEAWLCAPGAQPGRTAVSVGENSFSINWRTLEHQWRVFCSFRVRRRSKLIFSWEPFTMAEEASIVKIRLLGDFGRTTVQVTHSGLSSADQKWYDELWTVSLKQLGRLF